MSEEDNKQTTETKEQKSLGETAMKEFYENTAKLKQLVNNKSVSKKKLLRSMVAALHGNLTDVTEKPKDNIEQNLVNIIGNLSDLRTILLAAVIQASEETQNKGAKEDGKKLAKTGNNQKKG